MVVNFTADGKAYTEYIRNISNGGLCIDTKAEIHTGKPLTLVVHPPLSNPIKISGKVVWANSPHMGIQLQ